MKASNRNDGTAYANQLMANGVSGGDAKYGNIDMNATEEQLIESN